MKDFSQNYLLEIKQKFSEVTIFFLCVIEV